jgi:hypothetical protein
MARDGQRTIGTDREAGQASLMMLAVVGAVLVGTLVLFAFGNALGAKGRHQRAADLAAVSAAQVMRDLYPRLFEPPFLGPDVPNPRHLEQDAYLELARAAAVRGAQRNGARARPEDVRTARASPYLICFPRCSLRSWNGFAPFGVQTARAAPARSACGSLVFKRARQLLA